MMTNKIMDSIHTGVSNVFRGFEREFNETQASAEDRIYRQTARLITALSLAIAVTNTMGLVASIAMKGTTITTLFFGLILVATIIAVLLSRTKHHLIGAHLLILTLSFSGLGLVASGSENPSDSLFTTIPYAFVLASAFFPLRVIIPYITFNLLAIGILPVLFPFVEGSGLFQAVGTLFALGFLLTLIAAYRNSVEKTRLNELDVANQGLQDLTASLEQRVEDRTRALETSSEVSRRLSTILDPQQLVRDVVNQLSSAFGFYHVQIYMVDTHKESLQMVGGTGQAGEVMLTRGHQIKIGQGLVGRSAQENLIILVPDVSQEPGWLPNPLLPKTKAEVAVPIAIGPDVLGVLDVQHDVSGGLTDTDADLIQSIANQVAIAIQNAQAYERAQRQAVRDAQVVAIGQRIQNATTIDDVLKVAVSELGHALDAQRSSVELNLNTQPGFGRN